MQDYNYIFGGCMELTLELSCCKHPHSSNLLNLWNDNKVSLLTFITEAHKGVKGIVKDSNNDLPIGKANLTILGRDVLFQTDIKGRFWRILLPGDYILEVKVAGYKTLQKQFTVTENKITVINVYMAALRRSRTLIDSWRNMNIATHMSLTQSLTMPNSVLNNNIIDQCQLHYWIIFIFAWSFSLISFNLN